MLIFFRSIIGGLLLSSLLTLTGCYQLQHAVGCNNPGFFGCKDKAEPFPRDSENNSDLKRAPEEGRFGRAAQPESGEN